MRRTAALLGALALALGCLAAGAAADPRPFEPAKPLGASGAGMACYFTITASNSGRSDVWVMFYDSYISNKTNWLYMARRKLKIQNYRVAPGKRISAAYDAPGACWNLREWNIQFKQGSSFAWHDYTTSHTQKLDLGDVSKHF